MRFLISFLLLFSWSFFSQTIPCFNFDENDFIISGSAVVVDSDVVRLTQATGNQAGFVWSQNLVNFEQNFNLEAELYLGTQDFGADGIAFVLQPLSNNEGSLGGGIGYAGISPSVAVEIDTWWNSGNDPIQSDHVALIANGEPWVMSAHSAYVPYVEINNIEDGQWHPMSISWDSSSKSFTVILDNESIISTTLDIPLIFFDGNPNLYWGFTAATGGANNLQQVRIMEYCSFDSSCNTESPTAPSTQYFCESVILNQLQTFGQNVRFYSDSSNGSLLDPTSVINENTTVYISQTIDDCESLDLVEVFISIEFPYINSEPLEFSYCKSDTPIVNLYESSDLFLQSNFTGFFNTLEEAQNVESNITNPENFNVIFENQSVFARLENDFCYEVYTITMVPKNCDVFIPQAISPNNDGFNDVLDIQNLYDIHLNHSLKIFNRYGNCIFEGNNSNKWAGLSNEGQRVPVGTYFYILELNNDKQEVFTGWVYCNY